MFKGDDLWWEEGFIFRDILPFFLRVYIIDFNVGRLGCTKW
jgi:hypothetical protein